MHVRIKANRKWIGEEGHIMPGKVLFVDIKRARHLVDAGAAEFIDGPSEKKSPASLSESASLPEVKASAPMILTSSAQLIPSSALTTPTSSAVTSSTHATTDGGDTIKKRRGRPAKNSGRGI